jgi:hypothetical protein
VYIYNPLQAPWPNRIYTFAFYHSFVEAKLSQFPQYKIYGIAEKLALAGNHTAAHNLIKDTMLIQNNFLHLSVLLDPDLTISTDRESISIDSVMGSMGGVLNLWVGITFITVMEVVDFCISTIIDRFRAKKEKAGPVITKVNGVGPDT